MRWHLALAVAALMPCPAVADVVLACTFDKLPQAVMTYPEAGSTAVPTMQVDERPPVEMTMGQGADHFETAAVDGYRFQFQPATATMDVQFGTLPLARESGRCATVGGPVNQTPLSLAADKPQDETLAIVSALTVEGETSDTGAWMITVDKSALDGSRSVFVSLDSTKALRGQFGGSGKPTLILRCMENTTSAYLSVMDYVLSDIEGYGRVDFRVDDRKADHSNMVVSADNHSLGLWNGKAALPFIKDLFEGNTAVFRLTPFNESPVEFSFHISGVEAAVKSLREACKW